MFIDHHQLRLHTGFPLAQETSVYNKIALTGHNWYEDVHIQYMNTLCRLALLAWYVQCAECCRRSQWCRFVIYCRYICLPKAFICKRTIILMFFFSHTYQLLLLNWTWPEHLILCYIFLLLFLNSFFYYVSPPLSTCFCSANHLI